MGPCVGHSRKHLFFIITDSSGGSKYVREGILFCAWVLGFLYVDGNGILLAIYFSDQITLYGKKWQLLVLLLLLQKRRYFREKLFCCIKILNPRYDFFRCKYQRHPIMDRGYRVIWRCCQDGELLFFRSWLPDPGHVENFWLGHSKRDLLFRFVPLVKTCCRNHAPAMPHTIPKRRFRKNCLCSCIDK